jgi:hypothetical protein
VDEPAEPVAAAEEAALYEVIDLVIACGVRKVDPAGNRLVSRHEGVFAPLKGAKTRFQPRIGVLTPFTRAALGCGQHSLTARSSMDPAPLPATIPMPTSQSPSYTS